AVRQTIDEPDRVRHEELLSIRKPYLSNERIQRHEQRVRGFRLLPCEPVEQRGLARVRVADERNRRGQPFLPPLAQLRATLADVPDLPADRTDAMPDAPAIRFQLRFTRASRADAAAEPRERRRRANQTRQHVLQLRELDLQLPFSRSCAAREDIQD